VTYSHKDKKYLGDDSLLGFLKGLEREGFSIWVDKRLEAGMLWDDEIKKQMAAADIVVALISQSFLNSDYCQNSEMRVFLEKRKEAGLVIVPIIIAPCDWRSFDWLSATQFEPRDGKTIESDYKDRGKREGLFLKILEGLRALKRA
jgi:TIR domain